MPFSHRAVIPNPFHSTYKEERERKKQRERERERERERDREREREGGGRGERKIERERLHEKFIENLLIQPVCTIHKSIQRR